MTKLTGLQRLTTLLPMGLRGSGHSALEFLPAALEIQETPPSPLGRAIAWTLMIFFTIAVLWAIFGQIDIVATAQGKIIPSGHTKVIQPLEIGVVRKIYVKDGQGVRAGDVLIDLDPTVNRAEQQRLEEDLAHARLELARLRTQAGTDDSDLTSAVAQQTQKADPDGDLVNIQDDILRNQLQEYAAKASSLNSEIIKRKAELAGAREQVKKLEATLPLITGRAKGLQALSAKGLVAKNSYLELEQQRIEQQQDLATRKAQIGESQAAITSAEQELQSLRAGFNRDTLQELAKAEERVEGLNQEIIKARQRTALQQLTSPIAGVVQQLAVHTVGGVVTPAQQLMVIVPGEQYLEIEAMVQNKDIGFVTDGQPAEVKIETFPFTRYGTIDAKILHVSNDAIADEKLGLIYIARVLMKQSRIQVDQRMVNLTPGMAVTVEIKTGKRRLIEYFMSPLLRYRQESIRER
jgi:hemolysin D